MCWDKSLELARRPVPAKRRRPRRATPPTPSTPGPPPTGKRPHLRVARASADSFRSASLKIRGQRLAKTKPAESEPFVRSDPLRNPFTLKGAFQDESAGLTRAWQMQIRASIGPELGVPPDGGFS